VDGLGLIESDTTALIFISGGDKMPLGAPRLESLIKRQLKTTCGGRSACPLMAAGFRPVLELLDVAAQVELGAGQTDNSLEAGLNLWSEITPAHQPLGLSADGIERLHEVSLLQLSGVVAGH